MAKQLRSRTIPIPNTDSDDKMVHGKFRGSSNGTTNGRLQNGTNEEQHKQNGSKGTAANGHSHSGSNGIHGNGSPEKKNVVNSESFFSSLINRTFLPLFIIGFAPTLGIVLWYTTEKCGGSFMTMSRVFQTGSVMQGYFKLWEGSSIKTDMVIPAVFFGYLIYSILTMVLLPGRKFTGPVTTHGNIPTYKDNGFSCYLLSVVTFGVLTYALKFNGLTPTILYDRFNEMLLMMNAFGMSFSLLLYFKGRWCPSTTDSGTSGNFFFDYYWGTELYPRIFGIDVKVLINCRYGMTIWPLLVLLFTVKSFELHGFVDSVFVSATLQMVYITKFFWWESGYMQTIDIIVDRAGFYTTWGCLVFIPSLYTYVSMFLIKHPVHLGPSLSCVILAVGLASICYNYIIDLQRTNVRETNGNCQIWGKKAETIRAEYQLATGERKTNLLLVSGWWGVSRHFNYFLELILAFAWTVPAMFEHLAPYAYFIFLVILLVHRSFRDEAKCSLKYGKYWTQYCKRVPYRIIPYIF